jgi:hypothetical protein
VTIDQRPSRRRAVAAALAVVLALGGAACGDNENEPQSNDTGDTIERPSVPEAGTPESTPENNRPEVGPDN